MATKQDTKKAARPTQQPKAGTDNQSPLVGGTPPDTQEPKAGDKSPQHVRVIVPEGMTLGRRMLVNGDVTDDPDYVALLDVPGQKKVEAVK